MQKLDTWADLGLTEKQARFIELYVLYGNASRAYKEAGFTAKQPGSAASKLLKLPKMKKALELAKSQFSAEFQVSKSWIAQQLREIAANKEEPTMARLKALELLGKSVGMFVDRIDQNVQSVQYYLPAKENEAPTVEAEAEQVEEAPALPEPEKQKKA